MKISLDWISDYVDLSDLDPTTIADKLTLSTAEVEDLITVERSVEGVLVGEIVELEPIAAEGKTLHRAVVDCGTRRFVTVCGAPNVRVGMKSAFAPAGVTLAGETTITQTEMAGHTSEGVLCSAAELGMSRWHEGILELPSDLENGAPLSRWIPPTDTLIELDNKSLTHRPDLWGHYGFARELAAIFGRPLRPLPQVDLSRFDNLPAYPLKVEDPENCPCYACLDIKLDAAVPSPLIVQRRLHALGQRTFNLMVDLTNYVMLEIGQPTHAFDGDLVHEIRVAPMGRRGTFVTLDGQEREMLPEDLLIWNENEPVALAGVMGGLHSEVTEKTKRVLLESANFKAARIRKTSVRLDLRTDSAQRFEKAQPPVIVKWAVARILACIEEAGRPYEVLSRFTVAGDLDDAYRPLTMPWRDVARMAGQDLPEDEVLAILRSLEFEAKRNGDVLDVGIPPFRSRKDISIPADIIEEILRIYGYGRLTPRLPESPIAPLPENRPLDVQHAVRGVLAGAHRFVEVHNYAWTDDKWLAQLGFEPQQALELKNPAAQPYRRLRTTLVPNLLALVRPNRVHRDAFRLFEIGDVYRADGDGCIETTHLGGVSFQQSALGSLEEHFRSIRGAIEELGSAVLKRSFRLEAGSQSAFPWLEAKHWVSIKADDQELGYLAVLPRTMIQKVVAEGQVIVFELDLDRLAALPVAAQPYRPAPVYPGSWQDFSLLWDAGAGFAALDDRLAKFTHPLLKQRDFLYTYKGKGLPAGKFSYTFRFWIGADDHTLSGDEIESFRQAFLEYLKQNDIALR